MKTIVFVEDIKSEMGFGYGPFVEERKRNWNNQPRQFITLTVVPIRCEEVEFPETAVPVLSRRTTLYPELVRQANGHPTARMEELIHVLKGGKNYVEKYLESGKNPMTMELDDVDDFFRKLYRKFVYIDYDIQKKRFDMFSIEKLPNNSQPFEYLIPKYFSGDKDEHTE
jgi:hypothetical protein